MKSDLAWAAGLFEGEGCFSVYSDRGRPRPEACLASSDEDVVKRFHATVGFGSVYQQKPRGLTKKILWKWKTSGYGNVGDLFFLFKPYLGKRRTKKAEEVLKIERI